LLTLEIFTYLINIYNFFQAKNLIYNALPDNILYYNAVSQRKLPAVSKKKQQKKRQYISLFAELATKNYKNLRRTPL